MLGICIIIAKGVSENVINTSNEKRDFKRTFGWARGIPFWALTSCALFGESSLWPSSQNRMAIMGPGHYSRLNVCFEAPPPHPLTAPCFLIRFWGNSNTCSFNLKLPRRQQLELSAKRVIYLNIYYPPFRLLLFLLLKKTCWKWPHMQPFMCREMIDTPETCASDLF